MVYYAHAVVQYVKDHFQRLSAVHGIPGPAAAEGVSSARHSDMTPLIMVHARLIAACAIPLRAVLLSQAVNRRRLW